MEIRSVAEFVETEARYNCMKELHIDYAQGYLIAKPGPLDNLEQIDEETDL